MFAINIQNVTDLENLNNSVVNIFAHNYMYFDADYNRLPNDIPKFKHKNICISEKDVTVYFSQFILIIESISVLSICVTWDNFYHI